MPPVFRSNRCFQDGFITIITEYVPLGSLHRVLGDKPTELPWWLRVKFALDAADALQLSFSCCFVYFLFLKNGIFFKRYLHGKSVIHRDLKSSNLLVCSLEPNEITNCKLCDFGIARQVNTNMTLAQGFCFFFLIFSSFS